ncbi:hypothetical protein BYT27DRAFT_6483202 [Phlegmacium glaucopus]|nr:hypothetical protein BYT27DRAFT_6483202 [Phlegmacium glaucopus]
MSSESVPLALPSVPQDSRIVGKSRSQMAAMKAEDSVKTLVNRPKCERCARAGKDCLRRSDQLVGARCMKCVVSKKGCVYPSKKSASEKVHKARSNDKRERDEDDDDDDVGTLEKTPKFLRSSKKGKQLDESPGAAASSSQARRLVPFVDLVTSKKDSSSSLITKPFGSGDSSAIHHSTYGLVEHPHPSTTSLPVSSANYPSIVGNHEFRIKMLRVKLEALQEDLQLANQRRSERYPRYENGNIVALRHKLKELEGMQLEEIIKSGQRSKVHMHRPTFTSQLGHEEFYGSYISYTLT